MKVLVIDDEPIDLKLMGELLKTSGHVFRGSASVEEALHALSVDRPDVILVDLQLPHVDGLTLVRRFKSSAATRLIPVVAITAFPDRYPRSEVLAAGCVTCIAKPIDTRALARTLQEATEQQAP